MHFNFTTFTRNYHLNDSRKSSFPHSIILLLKYKFKYNCFKNCVSAFSVFAIFALIQSYFPLHRVICLIIQFIIINCLMVSLVSLVISFSIESTVGWRQLAGSIASISSLIAILFHQSKKQESNSWSNRTIRPCLLSLKVLIKNYKI